MTSAVNQTSVASLLSCTSELLQSKREREREIKREKSVLKRMRERVKIFFPASHVRVSTNLE